MSRILRDMPENVDCIVIALFFFSYIIAQRLCGDQRVQDVEVINMKNKDIYNALCEWQEKYTDNLGNDCE